MRIYVPLYQHFMPQATPENPHILSDLLVEISHRDLKKIILQWGHCENYTKGTDLSVFWQSVKDICSHPVKNGSIQEKPFLWRPAITVHCGSKSGEDFCKDYFAENMRKLGSLIAKKGFNLWYGGGNDGLMGETLKGYIDQIKIKRYPHQYSVQVVPADFVLGVKSKNGSHPANEGLGTLSDIAIVMPDFVRRRDLLDSICIATISGPGGTGTLDELSDVLTHYKIGKRTTMIYVMNLFVPEFGHGYYDNLFNHMRIASVCGLENGKVLQHITVKETPEEVMLDLMINLSRKDFNPHNVYEKNRNKFAPQKPQKTSIRKIVEKEKNSFG